MQSSILCVMKTAALLTEAIFKGRRRMKLSCRHGIADGNIVYFLCLRVVQELF